MAWYEFAWLRNLFGKREISDEEIKSSPAYNTLLGRFNQVSDDLRKSREEISLLSADSAVYENAADAKLRERDTRISQLESSLQNASALNEEYQQRLDALGLDYKRANEDNKLLSEENRKTRGLLALAKRLAGYSNRRVLDLRRSEKTLRHALKREVKERDSVIEHRADEVEKKIREEYVGGLRELAAKYDGLIKSSLDGFAYEAGAILKLREKELGLDKTPIVLLNHQFEPVCATSSFYRLFDLSLISDLNDVVVMDSTIEQARKGTRQPFCLQISHEKREDRVDVELMYARGCGGKLLGTFVIYMPQTGLWHKITHLDFGKTNSREIIQGNFIEPLGKSDGLGVSPA